MGRNRKTLVSRSSHDRNWSQTIADDRRRSQNFLRSAIRDPRSSAIIWKPALRVLMNPNRMIHHPTPSISPRFASYFNFHHLDSRQSSQDEKETRQTHCSCSCCVLRGPSCFSTQIRNSQPSLHQFFFSFWLRHYSIKHYRNEIATNLKE